MSQSVQLTQPVKARIGNREILNGGISFWMQDLGPADRRPPLTGSIDVDVAIVGGGMTGLWTAYYLQKADPTLSIAVIEKYFVGFGASGRNAGWLSAEPAGLFRHYAAKSGLQAAIRLQQEMFDTVDETLRVLAHEGIDADAVKDGLMYVAVNAPQEQRLRARFDGLQRRCWKKEDLSWLTSREVMENIHVAGGIAGYTTPHCARVNPAKLTLGLASTVEALGVTIYEDTTAEAIEPHKVLTDRGEVRAQVVVRALEGYTGSLRGEKRTLLPMNSSIAVTEPLSADMWEEMGWKGAHLLGDAANSYTYMQRTEDGRLAIGGRGVPYNFAGSFDREGRTATKAIGQLQDHLVRLFPMTRGVRLEYTWSGVLGVPRDWSGAVNYDRDSGIVTAGGYTGHGVAGTNLAARTVRDLIQGKESELTALPWVGHRTRKWELEPVRWIGATALYGVYGVADRLEKAGSRPSRIAKMADIISGRH
jgi:glycine/D-amino acid oxidase-like deaminating enzyme